MHYLDEGPRDAPAVLMVHGNPTWSFYYRNLVLALRDQYRCIVPDHIGCGLSDKPGLEHYDYRLASRIGDLTALIDSLGLQQPLTLVVHDWGGPIGMTWAVRHPRQVARLVILNTAAFPLPPGSKMPTALALVRDTWLGAWLVLHLNAFAGLAARVGFSKRPGKMIRDGYTGPYDSPANRIATLRFVQDIPLDENDPGFDILLETAEHLARLKNYPCLIAWGQKDFVFDEPFLRQWTEIYPQATVHRLPDCGHYVLEDGGTELLNTIKHFIAIKDDTPYGHLRD